MARNRSMNEWQKMVSVIRTWDRLEHNWAETQKQFGSMPTKNLTTRTDLIHSLMKKYKLTRRK